MGVDAGGPAARATARQGSHGRRHRLPSRISTRRRGRAEGMADDNPESTSGTAARDPGPPVEASGGAAPAADGGQPPTSGWGPPGQYQPAPGYPAYGPAAGQPGYGQASGQPSYGPPDYGPPAYGPPAYGTAYGAPTATLPAAPAGTAPTAPSPKQAAARRPQPARRHRTPRPAGPDREQRFRTWTRGCRRPCPLRALSAGWKSSTGAYGVARETPVGR